jgi:hypothetical protein
MFSAARTVERLLAFYFGAHFIFVVCFVVHAAPFFHYADPLAFLIPLIVLGLLLGVPRLCPLVRYLSAADDQQD